LPVKIVYDREEDMACSTKRHPSRSRIRSAFDGEGKLLALDIDFVLDAGAYTTMSPVVLSRGTLHAGGVYRCPQVRIHGRAVATNTPSHGAFRGFGAPQSLFAIERHMDRAAAKMGLDPVDLRRKNFLRIGDTMATGQVIQENLDLEGIMDSALAAIGYYEKRQMYQALTNTDVPHWRGVGFSVFMHGCGFTGSGETYLASVAGVRGMPDGRVEVLAASTEMGQGKDTVFAQIVAEALAIPLELVEVARPDTRVVPNSGPTVASRSTMIVGKLLQDAASAMKQTLLQSGYLKATYDGRAFQEAVKTYLSFHDVLKAYCQYAKPPHIRWDDTTYQGDAYPTYSWACYVADVSVDKVTYEVKVEDFVAVQEVGRVINPTLAAGQIEGGVAQGIGWALWEDIQWQRGRMLNSQLANYHIATSADLPRIRVIFQENPHFAGPGGAKGIGELPMDGPAPALVSALQQAIGKTDLNRVPMTPERILDAMEMNHG
jgi:CO/xanthine dehydrogenase Mo-binding subunit